MRKVDWVGDSLKRLKEFPDEVKREIGATLHAIQDGETPVNVKPFKYVGSGVFEIVIPYKRNAYRVVCAVQLGEKIYVLHTFQKKSKKASKTPQSDVELIRRRYREAQELAGDENE